MTKSTNHPVHGPVSVDRLHQIREHLQHDTQYSNGGNRAYILADVLKVIDGAISAFGAEPVAWRWFHLNQWHVTNDEERARDLSWDSVKVTPLYAAPPAPVVPTFDEWLAIRGNKPLGWVKDAMRESYDACRAAMLQSFGNPEQLDEVGSWNNHMNTPTAQAGNSPIIGIDLASEPDRSVEVRYLAPPGYVIVPIVPTEDMIINGFESVPDPHFSDEKEWGEYEALSGCRQAARRAELCWAAMIKAAPKQENI
ncbi:hypothetical protein ACVW6O_003022 [Escherichia coli]